MTWLSHLLGLDNASGTAYLLWSGVGSDLGELTIVGVLFAHYKRHTCHVNSPRFCWRPGLHPVSGTAFRTCARHHPTVPDRVTAHHIHATHREAGSP